MMTDHIYFKSNPPQKNWHWKTKQKKVTSAISLSLHKAAESNAPVSERWTSSQHSNKSKRTETEGSTQRWSPAFSSGKKKLRN